jgi:serine/threonine-protein kinase
MGVVYEGRNLLIMRRVAIKVLHAASAESSDTVARFEQEAQAAGRIGSKHIVEVLDLGHFPTGDRYMVMEFLEGESLRARMDRFPKAAPHELAPLIVQLLEGLEAAHAAGIIHRDLKPENVFLQRTRDGDFVKLLDFGISKFTQNNALTMTRTGAISGTPYYMSPEHACGSKDIDHRIDVYAVGVIMYEALAGCLPFDGEVFTELLFKIALETPKPLNELRPDLSAAWVQLVQRAMAQKPAQRHATARELQQAILTLSAGSSRASSSEMLPAASGTVLLTPAAGPPTSPGMLLPSSSTSALPGTVRNWARSEPNLPAKRTRAPLVIGLVFSAIAAAAAGSFWFFASKRGPAVVALPNKQPSVASAPALPTPVAAPAIASPPPPPIEAAPAEGSTAPPAPRLQQPARRTSTAAPSASAAVSSPPAVPKRSPRKLRREL